MNKTLIISVLLTTGVLSGCGTTTNIPQSTTEETTRQTPMNTATETNNQDSKDNATVTSTSETKGNVEEINLILQAGPCCPILSGSEFEEIIKQLPGVTKAKATAGPDGQMTIWYDPAKTSQSNIEIQISQKTGYFAEIK